MALKLTAEQIKEKMKKTYNGEYQLISPYVNNKTPITIKHKCGFSYTISKCERFFAEKGYDCPKCRVPKKKEYGKITKEIFLEKLKDSFSNQYEYVSGEIKSHEPIVIKHICGEEIKTQINNLFNEKRFTGCPKCRGNNRGTFQSDPNYLENSLKEAEDGSEYQWLEEYKGSPREKHKIKHLTCGTEYEVQPRFFRYGDKIRCPKCARKRSKIEIEFFNTLSEELSEFKIEYSNRSVINPYELDVFFPDQKFAIEFNGLYWHSEKRKGKKYHSDKLKKCQEKGIRLIQIFEDEWVNQKEIVLSKIKSALKIPSKTVIPARKCQVRDISRESKIIKEFLEENHIQGYTTSTYSYGLFFNEELVAVACFNKLRDSMNKDTVENSFDLIRFAGKIDYSIIGGCGKLLSNFVRDKKAKLIKTLADLRWSDPVSNMYLKLGFIEETKVNPRYFYTDGHTRIGRFSFRKSEIKKKFPEIYDEKLTEFEMMDKTKFFRIWDAGKITYVKYY